MPRLSELAPGSYTVEAPARPAPSLRLSDLPPDSYTVEDDRPPDTRGALARGLSGAVPTALSSLSGFGAQVTRAVGATDTAEGLERTAAEQEHEAERSMRRQVPSITDIPGDGVFDTISRAATWAGETVGQQAGNLVTAAVPGGAGAVVGRAIATRALPAAATAAARVTAAGTGASRGAMAGAGASSYAQNSGEIYNNIRQGSPDVDPDTANAIAAAAGVPAAALDVWSLGRIARPALERLGVSHAANEPTRRIISRFLGGAGAAAVDRALVGGGRGLIGEMPAEAAQEMIGAIAEDLAAGRPIDLTSRQRLLRFAEAGAAGGVAGAAFGGVTDAALGQRPAAAPPPPPPPPTPSPAAPAPAGQPAPTVPAATAGAGAATAGQPSLPTAAAPAAPAPAFDVLTPAPAGAEGEDTAGRAMSDARLRLDAIHAAIEAAGYEATPEQDAEIDRLQRIVSGGPAMSQPGPTAPPSPVVEPSSPTVAPPAGISPATETPGVDLNVNPPAPAPFVDIAGSNRGVRRPLQPGADGWKLHLNVADNPELAQRISTWLTQQGVQHKIGHDAGQDGKGMTIYVGHRDQAVSLSQELARQFTLPRAHPSLAREELPFAPGVMARFDISRADPEFHQYGLRGVPMLWNDVAGSFGQADRGFSEANAQRSERILAQRYGDYFTGTQTPAHLSPQEVRRQAEAKQARELAAAAAAQQRADKPAPPPGPPPLQTSRADVMQAARRRGLITDANPAWAKLLADAGAEGDPASITPDRWQRALDAIARLGPSGVAEINAAAQGAVAVRALSLKDSRAAVPGRPEPLPVRYALVELDDLVLSNLDNLSENPAYPQRLQPRDRTSQRTEQQILEIMRKMETQPEIFGESAEGGSGAPIIQPNGAVLAGNGRGLAMRRARQENSPAWQAYQTYLRAAGYPVDQMQSGVLVRVNMAPMTDDELASLATDLNKDPQQKMTPTEQALSDARILTPSVMGKFRGESVNAAANTEFRAAFLAELPQNEASGLVSKGTNQLTTEGRKRLEAAMFARAYGEADLVREVFEDDDSDIGGLGKALQDAAPAWSVMRAEAQAGTIIVDADWTAHLMAAVRFIRDAKLRKMTVPQALQQLDAFTPWTEADQDALDFLMNDATGKPAARDVISARLIWYAQQAMTVPVSADMFGADPAARIKEIVNAGKQRGRAAKAATQGSIFDKPQPTVPPAPDGGRGDQGGGDAVGPAVDQPGPPAGEAVADGTDGQPSEPATGQPEGPAPTATVDRARHYAKFIPAGPVRDSLLRGITNWSKRDGDASGAVTYRAGRQKGRAEALRRGLDDAVAATSRGDRWHGAKVTLAGDVYTGRGSWGVLTVSFEKGEPALTYHPDPQTGLQEGAPDPRAKPWRDGAADFAGFMNLAGTTVGNRAATWVSDRGAAEDVEYLVAIAGDGTVINAGTSDSRSNVVPPSTVYAQLYDPANAVVIHHNHPNGGPLSQGDLAQLALRGLRAIYAHGPFGIWYRAELGPRMARLHTALGNNLQAMRTNVDMLDKAYRAAFVAASESLEAARGATSGAYDVVMQGLHKAGVITFSANVEPSLEPDLQRAVDAAYMAANNALLSFEQAAGLQELTYAADDRRAGPTRAAGDMAHLPGEPAGDAAGRGRDTGDTFGRERDPLERNFDDEPAGEAYWDAFDTEDPDAPIPAFVPPGIRQGLNAPAVYQAAIRLAGAESVPPLPNDNRLKSRLWQVWKPQAALAVMQPRYAGVFQGLLKQVQAQYAILDVLGRAAATYFLASKAAKLEAHKLSEYGALHNEDYTVIGRPAEITNDIGGPTDADGMATMESGETLRITDEGWAAYVARRTTYDASWQMLRAGWLKKRRLPLTTGVADLRSQAAATQLRAEAARMAAEETFIASRTTRGVAQLETAASLRKGSRKAGIDASRTLRKQAARMDADANALEAFDAMRRRGFETWMRFGNRFIDVQRENDDGVLTTVHREHFYDTGLNRIGAAKRAEEIRKRLDRMYPSAEGYRMSKTAGIVKEKDNFDFGDVNFTVLTQAAAEGGATISSTNEVFDAISRRLSDQGFRMHLRRRNDVRGYSTDFERSLSKYLVSISGYLARSEMAGEIDAALANIKDDKILHERGVSLRDYVNSPQQEFGSWRAFMFFSSIATSVSSWLNNLTQFPLFTGPMMMMAAGPAEAARAMTRATGAAMRMFTFEKSSDPLRIDVEKAPERLREWLRKVYAAGVLEPTATSEMMGQAAHNNVVTRNLSNFMRKTISIAGTMFGGTEKYNRLATALAAIDVALNPRLLRRAEEVFSGSRAKPMLREAWALQMQAEALDRVAPERAALLHRAQQLEQKARKLGNPRFRYYQAEGLRRRAADIEQRAAAYPHGAPERAVLEAEAQSIRSTAAAHVEGTFPDLPAGTSITPDLFAQFMVEETQTIMGKVANPQMMRGPGRAIFQFKTFQLNMLVLQHQMATRYGKEGKWALAANLGALLMIGGVMALPFADDLKELFRALTGDDFEQVWQEMVERHFREATGADDDDETGRMFAEAVRRGMSRFFNVELTDRLGFGRVLPVRPFVEMMSGERFTPSQVVGDLLGVSASWITRGLSAYDLNQQGYNNKAMEFALSMAFGSGARNAMMAYNMATEGYRSQRGEMLMPAPDSTAPGRVVPGDVAWRSVGYQSARMARAMEEYRWSLQVEQGGRGDQERFARRMGTAMARQDHTAVAQIQQEIQDHNRDRPAAEQVRLNQQSMRRRIRRELEGMTARPVPRRAREGVEAIGQSLPSWRAAP